MIVSGEASGDKHGANLINELKKIDKDISIGGMGGANMFEAGLVGVDSTSIAVIGFVEVIKRYPKIKSIFDSLVKRLDEEKFDAVVLIDYPGFNLRFAEEVYKRNIPVFYYISPQVWAWKKGRVKQIARVVTKMFVAMPFEEDFYKGTGVDAEFVGHPLLDFDEYDIDKNDARSELGLGNDDSVIALLPGSRTDEVSRLLPTMLSGVEALNKASDVNYKVILPTALSVDDSVFKVALSGHSLQIKVIKNIDNNMIKALRASDVAVVASGTASLEAALTVTPMIIVYKVAFLTYWMFRWFAGKRDIGLPNIISGRRIVPELVQGDMTKESISEELGRILGSDDREVYNKMTSDLIDLKVNLGKEGAARRVAEGIYKII